MPHSHCLCLFRFSNCDHIFTDQEENKTLEKAREQMIVCCIVLALRIYFSISLYSMMRLVSTETAGDQIFPFLSLKMICDLSYLHI